MVHDPDLSPLLRACSRDDLAPLTDCLRAASTCQLDRDRSFRDPAAPHEDHAEALARELRRFGGNTIVNQLRGDGVPYARIVREVARRLGLRHGKRETTAQVEQSLLFLALSHLLHDLGPADRDRATEAFRQAGVENVDRRSGAPLALLLAQTGARLGGAFAYGLMLFAANRVARALVGHGLSWATNAALGRALGVLTGPVGLAATGVWTAVDLAGPAFRVTVPAVLHVAMLRQRRALPGGGQLHACPDCGSENRVPSGRAGRPLCGACRRPLAA